MSRVRVAGLALLLASVLSISGCFGSVSSVHVAPEAIPAGWTQAIENQSQEEAGGQVEIIVNKYAKGGDLQGEVYLVAVSDVPFVNEHKLIREQVADQAAGSGVQMEKEDAFDATLDNDKKVRITEYRIQKDVQGVTVNGKAWLVTWDASGFAAGGIGWATTEYETLLGGEEDTEVWEETQAMLMAAKW